MLAAARLRELLNYSTETGVFRWNHARGSVRAGSVAGGKNASGYIQIQVDGKNEFGHRLAWLYIHGDFPIGTIDHVNGMRDDNRIANLRDVSCALNVQNQRRAAKSNISCGLLGVSSSGNRWRAHIGLNGKQRYLGCFGTAMAAHQAYLAAKRKLHAGCTI